MQTYSFVRGTYAVWARKLWLISDRPKGSQWVIKMSKALDCLLIGENPEESMCEIQQVSDLDRFLKYNAV